MAHNCTDWTASPPIRKIPLLVLTRGDDHVYTTVPEELKTLEEFARREFGLGDVDIKFSSSCVNLCNGLPARITESAWELISPYIGCATVEVSGPRVVEDRPPQGELPKEQPLGSENTGDEHDAGAKGKLLLNTDERSDHGLGGQPSTSARELVRDEEDPPLDHAADDGGSSAPQDQHEDEEVSALLPRKSRHQRRVVSEAEDQDEESEQERDVPPSSQISPVASPPKPGKEIKKEKLGDSQSDPQPAEVHRHQPNKPIKQEKGEDRSKNRPHSQGGHSQNPHTESQYEAGPRAPAESSEKLMIRVAHRPSKQESKFTTKSTTKVTKVLTSACKSFGLDASRATMYLIISMEDEDGESESLFPCDGNDTIARAGAERARESRFLLKIAGEA